MALPFETLSVQKFSQLADKPAEASLTVLPGFRVDVSLAQPHANRITVMRHSEDGSRVGKIITFAQGLVLPHGIAFVLEANSKWLSVAELGRVVRYAREAGQTVAAGVPESSCRSTT